MAPTSRPKPTDATGRARAKALSENAAEVQRRASEMTIAAAAEAEALANGVYDPRVEAAGEEPEIVQDPRILRQSEEVVASVPEIETQIVDEVITASPDLGDDQVIVRLIADIETMTYGYGNDYSFKAGVKYKVARDLANHLESLGYLYA